MDLYIIFLTVCAVFSKEAAPWSSKYCIKN